MKSLDREENTVRKMVAVIALALAVLISAPLAHAQKGKRIPRIGLHSIRRFDDAFLKGLRDLGYVEGKNILIVRRLGRDKGTSKNCLIPPDFVPWQHFSHNSYPFSVLFSVT